jgi:transglutaminase-like putative cysteine protease
MKSLIHTRRNWIIIWIALSIFVIPTFAHAEEDLQPTTVGNAIPVFYNDEALEFHINPIIMDGTTLVEFRPIFEKLGLEITWLPATQSIIGRKEGLLVELQIGSLITRVNGVEMKLQLAPRIVNERTVVPLRFVGEAAGSYVKWNGVVRTIHLYRISPDASVTSNNYTRIQGRIPSDVRWVRLDMTKEGSNKIYSEYIQPQDGSIDAKIYLPDGAGRYQIEVFQSKLNHKETKFYERNSSFSVTNYGSSGLHLQSTTTDNSQLHLFGELLDGIHTVLLVLENTATKERKQVFFSPLDNIVEKDVYLTFGAGVYTLDIYTTVEPLDSKQYQKFSWLKSYSLINTDTRDPDLLPSEMVESEHIDIVTLALQITQGLGSDSMKSRAIHDWVVQNIAYDAATFLAGGNRTDTALQTLQGRLTDCDGYSRLNIALHRAAGIKARIIIGTVIDPSSGETWEQADLNKPNHAWNEVFIDGRWVTHDTTWNAGYIDPYHQFVRSIRHDYYDPAPERFALDHRAYYDLTNKYE